MVHNCLSGVTCVAGYSSNRGTFIYNINIRIIFLFSLQNNNSPFNLTSKISKLVCTLVAHLMIHLAQDDKIVDQVASHAKKKCTFMHGLHKDNTSH